MRLFLWPHRLLLIGPAFDTALHRHHAAQLCVGLPGPLHVRRSARGAWLTAWGFLIPPDMPHQLDAGGSKTAFLYLEPESAEYAAQRSRFEQQGLRIIQALAETGERKRWAAELAHTTRCREASDLAKALLGEQSDASPPAPLDERVRRALRWVAAHQQEPVRLRAVARAAGASESHLAHLFREQVGLPLRRYVLWRRLRVAVEQVLAGNSLTAAAHDAGFADAAHLSRTFRDTFGVTPSTTFLRTGGFAAELCADGQPGSWVDRDETQPHVAPARQ